MKVLYLLIISTLTITSAYTQTFSDVINGAQFGFQAGTATFFQGVDGKNKILYTDDGTDKIYTGMVGLKRSPQHTGTLFYDLKAFMFLFRPNGGYEVVSNEVEFDHTDFMAPEGSPTSTSLKQLNIYIPKEYNEGGILKIGYRGRLNGGNTVEIVYDDWETEIVVKTEISGPKSICSEDIYTIINPGTVTLENATNIATLTSLGNNQYKITRIGSANGVITLKATTGNFVTTKEINIGGLINLGIEDMIGLQDSPTGDAFTVLSGNGNYRYTGVLKVRNMNSEGSTTYSWTKMGGSTGLPAVTWSANGNTVEVRSKGVGGFITLICTATNGCATYSKEYAFYFGNSPW
ncbi:hypothetical protein [Sphingobacterium pedocola]|uniref:Ig-like domain-containing protein n=1 Tax=Sphingobacterium pedocola TaxID=2082722 RepID=A0ABR9T3A4_9SPHI|nr:hypothetical protein [Sphingobacterium pedocola]MBE8719770.1 hypothetical protein [Sphingobacterium pedocola]